MFKDLEPTITDWTPDEKETIKRALENMRLDVLRKINNNEPTTEALRKLVNTPKNSMEKIKWELQNRFKYIEWYSFIEKALCTLWIGLGAIMLLALYLGWYGPVKILAVLSISSMVILMILGGGSESEYSKAVPY